MNLSFALNLLPILPPQAHTPEFYFVQRLNLWLTRGLRAHAADFPEHSNLHLGLCTSS